MCCGSDLLQTEDEGLGTLDLVDLPGLTHGLLDDVAVVVIVLQGEGANRKGETDRERERERDKTDRGVESGLFSVSQPQMAGIMT